MTGTLTLCASCALGQTDAPDLLRQALPDWHVASIDCMSGCKRPSTAAFRAAGKTAYLFGDLTAQDLPDLIRFARAYDASPDGTFADARILGALRLKAIARIPG